MVRVTGRVQNSRKAKQRGLTALFMGPKEQAGSSPAGPADNTITNSNGMGKQNVLGQKGQFYGYVLETDV